MMRRSSDSYSSADCVRLLSAVSLLFAGGFAIVVALRSGMLGLAFLGSSLICVGIADTVIAHSLLAGYVLKLVGAVTAVVAIISLI
jgi:hypothetical protein